MTAAHWLNRKWKYADSKETSEPGYLSRRFAAIKREQKAKAEAERLAAEQRVQKVIGEIKEHRKA